MKVSIKRKTDEEIRQDYPVADRLPGWYFRVTETSNNVWLVEGCDAWGRRVSRQGIDLDELFAECIERAKGLGEP